MNYMYSRAKVEVWNENGELLLKVFPNGKIAAEETGFDHDMIRDACLSQTVYKGFLWKFRL